MRFLFLFFLLFSCTKNNKFKKLNQVSIALGSDVSTLDPATAYDEISLKVLTQTYETLFEYKYPSSQTPILVPLLATSLPEVSKDKLTYTFNIKDNVYYHPNELWKERKVKAQDFINQIKRVAFTPTRSKGYWLFEGKIKGIDQFKKEVGSDLEKMLKTQIPGVKLINDRKFSIQLTRPFPQMIYAMAMTFTSPIPIEAIRKYKNDLSEKIIATGPYQVSEFLRSHKITLKKNTNYHVPNIPSIHTINFPIIKEVQTRWLNFLKGKIDFFGIGKNHFKEVLNEKFELQEKYKKNFKLKKYQNLTYWWISFNMKDPLLGNNLNLRKAIAHAINWDKYIEIFFNKIATPANSIYHPNVYGYDKHNKLPYYHDLIKARDFLKKAGYPEGKGLPIINFDTRTNDSQTLQKAEFIKSELKKIGIKIKVTGNSFPFFLKKSSKGELQMWQDGWSLDYPDAENTLQLLRSKNLPPGSNVTHYQNEEVDKLIEQIFLLENSNQKISLLKETEELINKELPWIMQFYSKSLIIHSKRVKNYFPSALNVNLIKNLRLEQ